NGGLTPGNSHSWNVITQRFAYDFVIADKSFHRHEAQGTSVEDYYCYGQTIVSVADGVVVKVVNNKRTAPFVGYGVIDFLTTSFIGNHIIIKHNDHEFSFYAHLIKNSATVKVGSKVSQGQAIAKCGHSGYSSEPHLHFHLQNKKNFYSAIGLPIRFDNIIVDGERTDQASISVANRVQNL
ncbi:MAG: M23 family metallopeptidase, partial [Cyclobacteriaceae bacterium]